MGGHKPSTYIQTIQNPPYNVEPSELDLFFESHLIDTQLIRDDKFNDFILKRSSLLLDLIEESTGKVIVGRDSEEVISAFGGSLIKAH